MKGGFRPHQGINKFNKVNNMYIVKDQFGYTVSVPIRGSINLTNKQLHRILNILYYLGFRPHQGINKFNPLMYLKG